MADVFTVKSDLAAAITFELQKKTIPTIRAALVYGQFGQEARLTPGFDTLKFYKKPDLTSPTQSSDRTLAAETTNPQAVALPSITTVSATTTEYGYVVGVSRRAQNMSPFDLVEYGKDVLGRDAAVLADVLIRDEVTANGTALFQGNGASRNALTATDTITMADCRLIQTKLDSLNMPTADIPVVTHPFVVGDLKADTTTPGGWVAAHLYTASGNIYNGEVGRAYGLRFTTTTQCKTAANASAVTIYLSMAGLGYNSFGKASVDDIRFTVVPNTPDHQDPLGLTWKLGYYWDFAAKTLDSARFIRFESPATSV